MTPHLHVGMWLSSSHKEKSQVRFMVYILALYSFFPSSGLKYAKLFHLCRGTWQPTPVLLPGKSHGWRGLVGCSPWGCKESDMTEWLHFHFSLSHIGEGNGNPLQCSCLENPRDRGAWWAAVCGVTQSQTRLKRLSSSSSSTLPEPTLSIKKTAS